MTDDNRNIESPRTDHDKSALTEEMLKNSSDLGQIGAEEETE